MWQDYVIAAVIMMFVLTTIPMIVADTKVPLATAIPMTLGSCVLAVVYTSLGLWLSFGVEAISVLLWSILLGRNA